jgi:16S rRNA G966 N2-methylase RsmD
MKHTRSSNRRRRGGSTQKVKKPKPLKMTEEGKYSYTKPFDSKKIMDIMKDIVKDLKQKTITDATANIGGDTTAFARHFKHVDAIELKDDNFEALKENTKQFKNVTLHKGDSMKLYTWNTDVLYLDPPWGGPGYKESTNLDLFLGETRVDEWLAEVVKRPNKPKFIFLKLPANYNFERLEQFGAKKHQIRTFCLASIVVDGKDTV